MRDLDPAVVEFVREASASDRYGAYLRNVLMDLGGINTTPDVRLAETAAREGELFDWISRELRELAADQVQIERPAISPVIESDSEYSSPGYAAGTDGIVPPAEQVYAGRGSLVATFPGDHTAPPAILHAHVDSIRSWFAPRSAGQRVFARGACDSKGQIALLLAQVKLLSEIEEHTGRRPSRGRVYQLVIDGGIGGNGSLSLARDPRFAGSPVLMHGCTDLVPYCAHCGIVWYRCRLSTGSNRHIGAVELFPFVVVELEEEGRRIRTETDHPLFSSAHTQTNHGVLGCCGESPAVVCDHVAIEIVAEAKANPERVAMKLTEFLDDALVEYTRLYGDSTRRIDTATGRPRVDRHFEVTLQPTPEMQCFRIDVWGQGGDAGAAECDGAITKAAYLLGALLRLAGTFPGFRATGRLAGAGGADDKSIVLEGSQSFTPTHTPADVQARMTAAARRGLQQYCRIRGCHYDDGMIEMTFDRLRSAAYAADPSIEPMQALRTALAALGEPVPPVTAWETSCDARIYHHKGHPVAIFGAGKLAGIHTADEYIDIPDLQKALAVSTLATWMMLE